MVSPWSFIPNSKSSSSLNCRRYSPIFSILVPSHAPWVKQILPIDLSTPTAEQEALPLVRTNKLKYLGIQCSCSLTEYAHFNIEPMYELLKNKTQVWSRLSLGVMGCINSVKMILLPKLLYLFWHSPLYIPAHIFRSLESILNTFVWGSSRHKLSWQTLKHPIHLGGTALPDLALYYIASQLSHLYYLN